MSCKIQTSSKYTERPSPPIKAKDCPGETKKGNDGLMYTSKQSSNGVYRWSKKSTKTTKKVATTKAAKTPKAPRAPRAKKEPKPCKPDQVRNPVTGRCKKVSKAAAKAPRSTKEPKAPRSTKAPKAKAPKPCKPDQVRNPVTGRCKKIAKTTRVATIKSSVGSDGKPRNLFRAAGRAAMVRPRKSSSSRKSSPRTVGDGSIMNVSVEDGDFSSYDVSFEPVYSRPSGENWIFYDKDANEFRRPTFGIDEDGFIGGNQAMDQDEVEDKIDEDVPVWVVDGDFGEFEE